MKKLLTILLSLAMILSMGSVAFADESPVEFDPIGEEGSSTGFDINANIADGEETNELSGYTYKAEITWEATDIDVTRKVTNTYKWDFDSMSYVKSSSYGLEPTGSWQDNSDKDPDTGNTLSSYVNIKIKNKSDAQIAAEIKYEPTKINNELISGIWENEELKTEEENLKKEYYRIDSIFGAYLVDNPENWTPAKFDEFVLSLYQKCSTINALEKATSIANVITYLNGSDLQDEEPDLYESVNEFKDALGHDYASASDLLKLLCSDLKVADTFPIAYYIMGESLGSFETEDKFEVRLTEYGQEHVKAINLTEENSSPIAVGKFTVTVTPYDFEN